MRYTFVLPPFRLVVQRRGSISGFTSRQNGMEGRVSDGTAY